MSWLTGVVADLGERVRALLFRDREERELEEELRFHLEEGRKAHVAAGLSHAEARRRAAIDLGGVDRTKEEVRDARGVRWLVDLAQDVRYGARTLRRSPGFTVVAILSLGLGIGASTAVFSLVDAVMLRTLPVPDPDRLRLVLWEGAEAQVSIWGSLGSNYRQGGLARGDAVSHAVFEALRERTAAEAALFGFAPMAGVTVQRGGEASLANGLMVSGNFFEGLGVGASLGRVFTSSDPELETAEWVVLGHGWWQARLGGDSAAVGSRVSLNGRSFVVVGVLPRSLKGLQPGDEIDFYVPFAAQPALAPDWDRSAEDRWWVRLMARLTPGGSEARFRSVAAITFANAAGSLVQHPGIVVEDGSGGVGAIRDRYREPLLFLLAIVGTVILIACANLAGLSVARTAAREHEVAIRRALGAGRGRLVRLSLTESLLVGLMGGAAALPVALVTMDGLAALLFRSLPVEPGIDLRVLGFTTALALTTGLLSGAIPALHWSRPDMAERLGSRGADTVPGSRVGRALVVAQIAMSVVLLASAGLFGRSLLNLVRTDLGFEAENLLVFHLDPSAAGYDGERVPAFLDDVAQTLSAVPGVTGVAISRTPLLSGWMSGGHFFTLPEHPDAKAESSVFGNGVRQPTGPTAHQHEVNESYFDAMGIPLVLGRSFRRSDGPAAARVAIVNEKFVQAYFEGDQPLGQRIRIDTTDWTIVGVAADARYARVREDVPPTIYFSFRQQPVHDAHFAVRTAVPPLTLTAAVRRAVAAVDPGVPLAGVSTQRQRRDDNLSQDRLFAYLCGGLAGLALLLSCIGVYGLVAYSVARRTGEFGIRAALGASRSQITRPVLVEGLILTAGGLAIGLPAALAVALLLRSQLFGVGPADPASLGAGSLLLAAVALIAVSVPARRAANADPADALRAE